MNFHCFAKRGALAGALLLGWGGARAQAANFVVTNTSDTDGTCSATSCSLREAIAAANANPNTSDKITFANDVRGIINLTQNDSDTYYGASAFIVKGKLDIQGPGADVLTVQRGAGAPDFRLFLVAPGANVRITKLNLRGGHTSDREMGGGISNRGTLALVDSTLAGNTAESYGGGIVNVGTLTVQGSTIDGNYAKGNDTSGGIDNNGPLTLINSTFTGNICPLGGGNSGNGGGLWTRTRETSRVTVQNCTFVNNSAGEGASGILVTSGTVNISNTLVAANFNNANIPDVGLFAESAFASGGYNLIGNVGAVTSFTAPGDKKGTSARPLNPKLGPLQNNGGPTSTFVPLSGSPAINAGDPAFKSTGSATVYDQRGIGYPRVSGNRIDIGAFEVQAPRLAPVITHLAVTPIAPKTNDLLTAQIQANRSGVVYTYQWKKNGVNIKGATGPTLDLSVAGNGDKGNRISVAVVPSDRSGTGKAVTSAQVTVGNTVPTISKLALSSRNPNTNATIGVVITASDLDNDELTYTYQWKKNGVAITGETGPTFNLATAGNGDKGDKISVTVVASDGTGDSTSVTSPVATVTGTSGASSSPAKSSSSASSS